MPAQISSILDGPAGPPPAIDKPSLRRLAEAISALPESRLGPLVQLLVRSGITEHDATLNLDLESLPIRVFRQVWHCVYDPSTSGSGSHGPTHTILVAHVREEDSKHEQSPIKHEPPNRSPTRYALPLNLPHPQPHPQPHPHPHPLKPEPDEHKGIHNTPAEEDDELQDDDDSELGPGPSSVPAKRKAPSSSSSKQKSEHTSPSPTPHPHSYSHTPQPSGRIAIKCNYSSPIPDFPLCTRTFSRVADMRRHIEHQHTEEEAQATIDGRITKAQATLLGEDWKGTIKKPTCDGCGQTFSRKDAVKRHQTETGARIVDGVCVSCPGSGNGAGAGKKRARRK
ncbi:hypothetical protein RSOLAG1IB_04396 [Rhizoctonia solani AG-1 IB]|uniref:C2H2-type domain-containing protein n=1 Tax=Thanatephorus cucumeris (strain AG1-IB / isolate 7/3/14) TaxID=1108050 RepID=A0A0B7FUN1_THACB|nr:hypothetical protein RSOLAG1IB_04396 [Rhizoctonia solani AG-1 IB]